MHKRHWALVALAALAMCIVSAPAIAAPPLEAYGKLPQVEQMSISPSGDRYAMIAVTGDTRQLVIMSAGAGKPIVTNFSAKDKLRSIEWAGDDHILVTATGSLHDGAVFTVDTLEITEVVVVPLNGHPSFVVFGNDRRLLRMVAGQYGYAEVEGRWYGYFGGLNRGLGEDIYRVDLDTGAATQIRLANGGVSGVVFDKNGTLKALSYYFNKTGAWQVNSAESGKSILTGHTLTGGPSLVGLGRTSDTLLVYNPDPKVMAYQIAPLSGGEPKLVSTDQLIASPLFDRRTGLWIGNLLEGNESKAVLFKTEHQLRLNASRKAFEKYNVTLISYDSDFNHFIIYTDGSDDSGTYWLVDSSKHSVESIGQAYPGVTEKDVGPVSVVDWKAADGLDEHGVLTLPAGRAPRALPVVVLPHGGPEQRDLPGFDWWAQAFASRGYAVFQPNFRGSSGYGPSFVIAGHGEWGRKMQSDISDGLAALASRGVVDPKRACIVGASYGGYAALAGVTLQQRLYRCAVADAGVTDLRRMLRYEDSRSGDRSDTVSMRYWKQFMGAKSETDQTLDALSPARLADHADAPILLIHGKDDSVVPIEQSLDMQAALQRAGKPVELVVMPNEDHWLSRADTRLSMLTAAVAFVQKYNPAD